MSRTRAKPLVLVLVLAIVLGLVLAPRRAQAQEPAFGEPTTAPVRGEVGERRDPLRSDGVYGRFEGDLDLGLGAGVDADADARRGAARLTFHYFSTLGLAVEYASTLADGETGFERLVSLGVDVRPAFLPRLSEDLERGPAFSDLLLDSISLGLGAYWVEPRAADFGDSRGFELSGGFGLPLFGSADGLWLEGRGILRWPDPAWSFGERADGALLAVLSWHFLFLSPMAASGRALSD